MAVPCQVGIHMIGIGAIETAMSVPFLPESIGIGTAVGVSFNYCSVVHHGVGYVDIALGHVYGACTAHHNGHIAWWGSVIHDVQCKDGCVTVRGVRGICIVNLGRLNVVGG